MLSPTSELGEEVYLTDEDLVELKLNQSVWSVLVIVDTLTITEIITEIYNTTNLFNVIKTGEFSLSMTPKIEINIWKWNDKKRVILHPGKHYYPSIRQRIYE